MSLKRINVTKEPSPAPEIKFTDVLRLQCVLDNKLPLEFDLNEKAGDSYKHDKAWLTVTLGKRRIQIAAPRILYVETFPSQLKEIVTPK
jgi:hypothetical protein